MKMKALVSVFLILVLLGGCTENIEVRPGVYMSNDPADFPFPTSGYTVYFVGESHGNHETKSVFQAYLKKLYKEAGLRDVILEEDQAYETEANAYVHGATDELPTGLCLRADILRQIREFNSGLSDNEKVTVHLVDVDSPFPIVYKHLVELHSQLGEAGNSISIPELSEFQYSSLEKKHALIDELRPVSNRQSDILNGLETVRLSLEWYYSGNEVDTGWPIGTPRWYYPIREDVITKNIEYILSQLDGKPVLAFFGLSHGMKVQAYTNPPVKGFKSWAQRLAEKNISIYSTAIYGVSGTSIWRGKALPSDDELLKEFQLMDGTTIISLFDSQPDSNIIYSDLREESNSTIKLSADLLDIPASQFFDGIIIFKEFTPMENVCPQ